jgi:3-isopropylmalate/(R)-2-methylmalate dehydratase small subunit
VETARFAKSIAGRALKLGDEIDTDLIYPGKYVPVVDPVEWPKHALEGIDPDFPNRIRPGDLILAGRNFGCGSSRSQAVSCLKLAGIVAIVASSFGRIFFRNAINQGLPVIECADAHSLFKDQEILRIDLVDGKIEGKSGSACFQPLPAFMMQILSAGGLVPFTRSLIKKVTA